MQFYIEEGVCHILEKDAQINPLNGLAIDGNIKALCGLDLSSSLHLGYAAGLEYHERVWSILVCKDCQMEKGGEHNEGCY